MDGDIAAILVKKASLEFDKMAGMILEEQDLTPAQFKVIKYLLEESENGVRIVDLERYFSMSHPTAIGIVQNLEKKGLAAYRDNPNNARSRFIVPTEEGLRRQEELEAVGRKIEDQFTINLSGKERAELIFLLKKMMGLDEH